MKAPNLDEDDYFGRSVSLSSDGNTLAVGATGEDSASADSPSNNSIEGSGAAYIFIRGNDNSWINTAYLKASNAGSDDMFGGNLVISADGLTLAVGAEQEDSSSPGTGNGEGTDDDYENSGAVYVFTYNNDEWKQQAYLKPEEIRKDFRFGSSLSISEDGSTLAIGSVPWSSYNFAYIFSRTTDQWQQTGRLISSNFRSNDAFGYDLSLSADGKILAAGAPGERSGIAGDKEDESAPGSGAVYIFRHESGTWAETAYLKASNIDEGDEFGNQVSLSADGTLLGVGAIAEASAAVGLNSDQLDNSARLSGAAYVFRYQDGEWQQKSYLKALNTGTGGEFGNDAFSESLALSADGSILAASAPGEDSSGEQNDDSAENSGAVYLY